MLQQKADNAEASTARGVKPTVEDLRGRATSSWDSRPGSVATLR